MKHIKRISIGFFSLFLMVNCKNKTEAIPKDDAAMEKDSAIIDIPEVAEKVAEYDKTLSYKGYTFEVTTNDQELSIQPKGLEKDNSKIIIPLSGEVTNVQVEDLNNDGSPELLIYVKTEFINDKKTVIGYSVNDGKSISAISFHNAAEDTKHNSGYVGHDEFAVVGNIFSQRFPLYEADGTTKTGKMRQIKYKLNEGEAEKQLVADKAVDF